MRKVFHGRAGIALAFILGLLIATAATAGAASLITGKQIKDGSISSKDLSKAVRAQLKKAGVGGPAGLTGVAGKDGVNGVAGKDGVNGKDGSPGPAGTARAYAVVTSAGDVVPVKTKGLTATRLALGTYCVTPTAGSGLGNLAVVPVATPDYSEGSGVHHIIQVLYATATTQAVADVGCPGGWTFFTDDVDPVSTANTRTDIAFSVIVP